MISDDKVEDQFGGNSIKGLYQLFVDVDEIHLRLKFAETKLELTEFYFFQKKKIQTNMSLAIE